MNKNRVREEQKVAIVLGVVFCYFFEKKVETNKQTQNLLYIEQKCNILLKFFCCWNKLKDILIYQWKFTKQIISSFSLLISYFVRSIFLKLVEKLRFLLILTPKITLGLDECKILPTRALCVHYKRF